MPGRIVGMTVVYLVQHGEKQSLPGDPGLTAKGRQQATRTGRWLRGLGVHTLCKRTGSEEHGHARGAGFYSLAFQVIPCSSAQ